MRKIILDLAISLDGFIEGPNGEIDWIVMDENVSNTLLAFLEGIDTIFYGRVSYDLWGQYQPAQDAPVSEQRLWAAVHSKQKYVFSQSILGDGKATFINSDVAERVKEICHQYGGNIWLYGGASLITTFINLDLIDVYRLTIYPVILGEGKPVFDNIKRRINLKLEQGKGTESGNTFLEFIREGKPGSDN